MSYIIRLYILRILFNITYKPFEYCMSPPVDLSSTIFKVLFRELNYREIRSLFIHLYEMSNWLLPKSTNIRCVLAFSLC